MLLGFNQNDHLFISTGIHLAALLYIKTFTLAEN